MELPLEPRLSWLDVIWLEMGYKADRGQRHVQGRAVAREGWKIVGLMRFLPCSLLTYWIMPLESRKYLSKIISFRPGLGSCQELFCTFTSVHWLVISPCLQWNERALTHYRVGLICDRINCHSFIIIYAYCQKKALANKNYILTEWDKWWAKDQLEANWNQYWNWSSGLSWLLLW